MPDIINFINDNLHKSYFNNTLLTYIISAAVLLLFILLTIIIDKVLLSRVKKIISKTESQTDDFFLKEFHKRIIPILYYGSFYFSIKFLTLHIKLVNIINIIFVVIITYSAIQLITKAIYFILVDKLSDKETNGKKINLKGIMPAVNIVIWGIGIIFIMDNLGLNISAVVTGLGIGGIAVALAAQALLGDLFSYFSILLDKPFELGDFIIIGDYLGTIEHIGLKTTRIRSLSGEQLIFSNTDLTSSRVRNYKRMETRRIVFKFGVIYGTPNELLKEIPSIVKEIISNIQNTRFDRAHFSGFAGSSLDFEVVYYVLSSDYNIYMDIQQEINLNIKKAFEGKDIDFAFPTQTIYMAK